MLGENILGILTGMQRLQGTQSIIDAANFIESEAKKLGLKTKRHSFSYDGESDIGFKMVASLGWKCTSASLTITQHEEKIIEDYKDNPYCVPLGSPSGDITAPLAIPNNNWDNINGKIALVELMAGSDHPRLINLAARASKNGAKALLFYRNRDADAYTYVGLFLSNKVKAKVNLIPIMQVKPNKTGDILKDVKAGKEITAHLAVNSEYSRMEMPVIEARIEGETGEYILYTAHYCHAGPGANDNASGSSGLFDVAKHFSDKNERPKKGFVFLWVPEYEGSLSWIKNNTLKIDACINLDMIAASQLINESSILLQQTTWSLLHPVNAYVDYYLHSENLGTDNTYISLGAPRYRMISRGYSIGSDHDALSISGVPGLMIFTFPDKFYHSSEDKIDKLDLKIFSLITTAVAKAGWDLANTPNSDIITCWIHKSLGNILDEKARNIFSWFANKRLGLKLQTSWAPNFTNPIKPLPQTSFMMHYDPDLIEKVARLHTEEPNIDNLLHEAVILSREFPIDTVEEILEAEFGKYSRKVFRNCVDLLKSTFG